MCAGAGYESYKYKITVNVEANGKTYSGSSVQFQSTTTSPDWISNILLPETKRKGEAVVVNVDGKYLFFLWNYSIDKDQNYQSGFNSWQVSDVWESHKYGEHGEFGKDEFGENVVFTEYKYTFVTFTDINAPLTVKEITQENLSQYFGEGAKITSIEVQRTFKPVSYGQVEEVIPWIRDDINSYKKTMRGKYFTSDSYENKKKHGVDRIYAGLSSIQFIRE